MLLHEVALMLALKVDAPTDGILELSAVCDRLLEDLNALGILQADEFRPQHALQAPDQLGIIAVVEELDVVVAVVQRILHQVLDEVLGEVHVVVDVVEGHFRLDHPELGEVARGVGVLQAIP